MYFPPNPITPSEPPVQQDSVLDELFNGEFLVDGHLDLEQWNLSNPAQYTHGNLLEREDQVEQANTVINGGSYNLTPLATSQNNTENGMSVVLMHKPRGSKGEWLRVNQRGSIRVTKGKGKRLKLVVCTNTNISQAEEDVQLLLVVDGNQILAEGNESGLIKESVKSLAPSAAAPYVVTEVYLKLSHISRRLSFVVRVKTMDPIPHILEARSIEFSAHNNGKESSLHSSLPHSPLLAIKREVKSEVDVEEMKGESKEGFYSSPSVSTSSTSQQISSQFTAQQLHSLKAESNSPIFVHSSHSTKSDLYSTLYYPHTLPTPHELPRSQPDTSEQRKRMRKMRNDEPTSSQPDLPRQPLWPPQPQPPTQKHHLLGTQPHPTQQLPQQSHLLQQLQLSPLPSLPPLPTPQPQQSQQLKQPQHSQPQQPQPQQPQPQQPQQPQPQQPQPQPQSQSQLQQPQPQQPQELTTSQIVTGGLDVQGVVRAQAFRQYSDARLKTDIADLTDALKIVTSLEGKTYMWKQGQDLCQSKGNARVIGLIAQEVQKILPEVVHEVDGYLSVAYTEIVPVLIEALKQHLANDAADKQEIKQHMQDLDRKVQSFMNEQDEWKSYCHTMAAMRVLSLCETFHSLSPLSPLHPLSPPLNPLSSAFMPPTTEHRSTPSLTHSSHQLLDSHYSQPSSTHVVTYQPKFTQKSSTILAHSNNYIALGPLGNSNSSSSSSSSSSRSSSRSSSNNDNKTKTQAQALLLPPLPHPLKLPSPLPSPSPSHSMTTVFRRWLVFVGLVLGVVLLVGGVVLLRGGGRDSDVHFEGGQVEFSVVLLGLGVVCLISVSIFYACSKKMHRVYSHTDSDEENVVV